MTITFQYLPADNGDQGKKKIRSQQSKIKRDELLKASSL